MKFLKEKKFNQIAKGPTHKLGRCLDHVYIHIGETFSRGHFITTIEGCYYSDHDKLIMVVRKVDENCSSRAMRLARKSQDQGQDSGDAVRQSERNGDGEGDGMIS